MKHGSEDTETWANIRRYEDSRSSVNQSPREIDDTSAVPTYELESKTDRPELEGALQQPQELEATEIPRSHLNGRFDS